MLTLTDKLTESIATRVEKGVPLPTALRAAGITDATVQLWHQIAQGEQILTDGTEVDADIRQWVSEFVTRIGRAEAVLEANLVEGITEASETVGRSGVREWRSAAWLLNNSPKTSETYRQKREVRITGTVKHSREDQFTADASFEQLNAWSALALPGD